jgi:membrane protease YdiL (CAAX protease family)
MHACSLDISGMNFLRRCTAQLGRLHPLLFIYVVWILSYGVLMPLIYLDSLHPHDALHIEGGPTNIRAYSLGSRLVLGSLIVPAIETAIFQWLPVRLLRNGLKLPPWIAIAASAVFFGLAHGYSSGYMVFTTLIGAVLAWAFVARDHDGGRAYLWVGVVHALRNALSTILM